MIYVCIAVFAVAAIYCFWCQGQELKRTQKMRTHWWLRSIDLERERNALQTKLDTAEKALIDLEGQTPGRDNTGRFVSRDKVSIQKV